MNTNRAITMGVSVVVGLIVLLSAMPVRAAMTLEASTTWKDSGNTRVHGVFVGNVGSTGGPEVVTAGETVSGAGSPILAELRVWEHSGSSLTLKASATWQLDSRTENVWLSVHAGDPDDDGTTEIVTVGYTLNGSTPEPVAAAWTYGGSSLTEEASWTTNLVATFRSVHVAEVYGGSPPEILVAGDTYEGGQSPHHEGLLALFSHDGSELTKDTHTTWGGDAIAYSVHAENLDGSGAVEIVTAGYVRTSTAYPKNAEVRAWTYSGSSLSMQDDYLVTDADSVFYGVHNANVDNDGFGVIEIVACGYLYSPSQNKNRGLLDILHYASSTITRQVRGIVDHGSEAVCRSVHNGQLDDADEYLEITYGGWALYSNVYHGEIMVFQYAGGGGGIDVEDQVHWYTTGNTKVNSVCNGELDGDDGREFTSGGQAHDGSDDRGELRVYHL